MGKRALQHQRTTRRHIRREPLSNEERAFLRANAAYEGSPLHKRNPGDFGLTPPASPRPDKTLCDEASVFQTAEARRLFERALERGLVSEQWTVEGFPKQLWSVDEDGQAFEAIHGGSKPGCYHGYPIRRSDPFFDQVIEAWERHGS